MAQVLTASQIGDQSLIPVVLADAPLTTGAESTVQHLRQAVHQFPGAIVGGDTAADLDTRSTSVRDARVIMPLVLAVILVILVLVLRASVAPLILIATVVLSYVASLGASSMLFQHVFGSCGDGLLGP